MHLKIAPLGYENPSDNSATLPDLPHTPSSFRLRHLKQLQSALKAAFRHPGFGGGPPSYDGGGYIKPLPRAPEKVLGI